MFDSEGSGTGLASSCTRNADALIGISHGNGCPTNFNVHVTI